jgi:hypothetical protein
MKEIRRSTFTFLYQHKNKNTHRFDMKRTQRSQVEKELLAKFDMSKLSMHTHLRIYLSHSTHTASNRYL